MTDLSGKVLRDRYRIVRKIGEGAMSEVYLAAHVRATDRRYAVKVMKHSLAHQSSLGHRFRDEGDMLRRLDHPGIVKVHDCFDEGGALYMVLAYVDGQSLADALDASGAMDPSVALPMFKGILSALDYSHRAGVIHRDIKPSNILIDRGGYPQLCDFGIARQIGQRGLTGAGMTLGTPHYMSPEQIQSPQSLDHRSDLYSAGVMLYEMLTGKVPFGNAATDSDYSILQQQIHAEPPDPRGVNPRLDERLCKVIDKALRKDRDRRFQGASEFWDAVAGGQPDPDRAPPLVEADTVTGTRAPAAGAKRYAVFLDAGGAREAIKVGFSWPALCFGAGWMLAKRLYVHAGCWLACAAVFLAMLAALAGAPADTPARALAGLLLAGFVAMAVLAGLRGNLWLADRRVRDGWLRVDEVAADSARAALERAGQMPAREAP